MSTLTATQRGWGDPRSADFESTVRSECVWVEAGGVRIFVRADVADVFGYLNTMLARRYNLALYADDYGLAIRPIRGDEKKWAKTHDPKYLSNHSYGLAEDLDASINPMTRNLKAQHEFIRQVVDPILAEFGGRLVWGGEYSGPRKDYMHFEYVGTRKQAAIDSARARQLLAQLNDVHAHEQHAPTPIEEPDMQIVRATGKSTALLTSTGKLVALEAGEGEVYIKLGIKATTITPAEFAKLDAVSHRVG